MWVFMPRAIHIQLERLQHERKVQHLNMFVRCWIIHIWKCTRTLNTMPLFIVKVCREEWGLLCKSQNILNPGGGTAGTATDTNGNGGLLWDQVKTVLGRLGPGQSGSGQLSPGQLGPEQWGPTVRGPIDRGPNCLGPNFPGNQLSGVQLSGGPTVHLKSMNNWTRVHFTLERESVLWSLHEIST